MRFRRVGVAVAFALATAFAPWQMAPASAVTCSYDGLLNRVDVALGGNPSDSLDIGPGNSIRLDTVQCGAADVNNTDTIAVTGGGGSNALTIVDPASFQPGFTPELTGNSEIEIQANLNLGTDSLTLQGTSGGDTFVSGVAGVNANGDDDDDDVTFTSASLKMVGLGGNDQLTGGAENDTLVGGIGNDDYVGGGGNDTADLSGAVGGVTVDLLAGTGTGEGSDTFASVENVVGSANNDTLTGDGQQNTLQGAGGDDTLAGGGGNDDLQGGVGVNTAAFSSAVTASLFTGSATGEGTDTLTNIQNLHGSTNADTLIGDGGPNTLFGDAGDDTLIGRDGDDILQGGAGMNTVDFSTMAGPVTVLLGVGQATGQGTDTLASIQGVIGSAQGDTIAGVGVAENLNGGDGNDTITGGLGNDTLVGGLGNDTMDYSGAGNPIVAAIGGTATGQGTDTLSGFETLIGSKQGDQLTGSANPDVLVGRAGSDRLVGQAGDDKLIGATGNDRYEGGLGSDTASFSGAKKPVILSLLAGTATGEGADTLTGVETAIGSPKGDALRGGNGNDTLRGGGGNDRLTGLLGNDSLVGGPGRDSVNYGSASGVKVDLVKGTATGEGSDTLSGVEDVEGDSQRDIMIGNGFANALVGNNGNDVLRGGGGNDKLVGVSGNDTLSGGPGSDLLLGGDDNDALDGGPGTDTCHQSKGHGPVKSCERPRHRAYSPGVALSRLVAARFGRPV